MNKEQQIAEIEQFIYDYVDSKRTKGIYLFSSCVNELAKPFVHNKGLSEALYNAGYRKVPKGSFICSADETNLDVEVCNNCEKQQADELFERDKEIERLKVENNQLQEKLNSANAGNVNCSGCGLVETNAVKEFAERVKLETTVDNRLCVREYDIGYNDGYSKAYYSFHKIIDGLLKEYEK